MNSINLDEYLNNSSFNTTLEDEEILFPDSYNSNSYSTHILLGVIAIAISVLGIFGNIVSIVVLSRQTMNKLSTYAYLIALSVCDAVSLVFTIIALLQYSIVPGSAMPKWMVTTYPKLLSYVYPIVGATQALSVWITLALTIDRYLYVCKPYLGNKLCTRKRSCYVICSLYLLSIIYSIPQFFEYKYDVHNITSENILIIPSLTEIGRSQIFFRIYHIFIYTLFICLIPFGTISILNAFLINNIMESNKRHRNLLPTLYKTSLKCALVVTSRPQEARVSMLSNGTFLFNNESCLNEQDVLLQQQHRQTPKSGVRPSNDARLNEKAYKNDVTILLIGLVIMFMICQLPSTILRLIAYKDRTITFNIIYQRFMDISNFLIVLNSTSNCLVYVMLGKKFRKEFLHTMCPNCFLKKTSTQIYIRRLSIGRNIPNQIRSVPMPIYKK
jgi:hypothetical protein